jgi:MFS transporter, putative metabolite:H+ symporter
MAETISATQVPEGRGRGQTIEAFVSAALDDAKISPLHVKVVALIAAGYFFDVIDLIVLGALIPDMIQSKFATGGQAALIGSATVLGMFIGTAGQGEFSDRFGRRFVYQFNLLLFGTFTILGALAPNVTLLVAARFIAGLGLGAEQPLAFAYAGEYAPKRIRGRILAFIHFIGGACVWPIAALFTLAFRDAIGWRGVWIVIGLGALIVWVFRFTLPESPRSTCSPGLASRDRRSRCRRTRRATPGATRSASSFACSRGASSPG